MIIIAGEVKINPEHRAEAIQLALRMAEASQAEPGCVAYKFYADLQALDTFFIFEAWETKEALAAHFQTEHMKEFQQALPKLAAETEGIKRYEVQSVSTG